MAASANKLVTRYLKGENTNVNLLYLGCVSTYIKRSVLCVRPPACVQQAAETAGTLPHATRELAQAWDDVLQGKCRALHGGRSGLSLICHMRCRVVSTIGALFMCLVLPNSFKKPASWTVAALLLANGER